MTDTESASMQNDSGKAVSEQEKFKEQVSKMAYRLDTIINQVAQQIEITDMRAEVELYAKMSLAMKGAPDSLDANLQNKLLALKKQLIAA